MSLPTLDQIIDTIIRSKKLLASTIKHNIGLGKLEILDIALDCRYCGRPKTHMVDFDFNTLMGRLQIRICQQCRDMLAQQAKKEKEDNQKQVEEK